MPWQRPHAVPSGTVLSTWRTAIGEAPLQQLQRELLAAVVTEHRDPALPRVEVGGGLRLGRDRRHGDPDARHRGQPGRVRHRRAGRDRLPADPSPARLRRVHPGHPRRGVRPGRWGQGRDKGEAEQALLDRMLAEQPQVFDPDRLWIMDRNFPGVPRIAALLATGSHVLVRVKSDIRLPRISPFAADGSYLTRLSGGGTSLTMRVVEYHVTLDGQTTPELFCLVTDLLDHTTHPAHLLAQAYRWRWDGSETALREAKSAIHDAGPGTGAILRSTHPELIRQEHAAWTTATELVRAATRSRRRHRRALPQRSSHRAARRRPAPVVHHRPPHPDHHRAGRYRHRLAARTHPGRRPPARPGPDRHRPRHHRPAPPPRPQDQNQAGVPARPARHHHPHRPRARARLRPPRPDPHRLVPRPGHHPGPEPGAPGQTAGPPPCAPPVITLRTPLEDHHKRSAAPRTTSSPWHCSPATRSMARRIPGACPSATARAGRGDRQPQP